MKPGRKWAALHVDYLQDMEIMLLQREFGRLVIAAWWPRLIARCKASGDDLTIALDPIEFARGIGDDRPENEVAATMRGFIDRGLLTLVSGDVDLVVSVRLAKGDDWQVPSATKRSQKHRASVSENAGETSGGYVYAIVCRESGRVKVGFAKSPTQRLAALQTGSAAELYVHAAIPGDYALEKRVQRRLKNHHEGGEWFGVGATTEDVFVEHFGAVETASKRRPNKTSKRRTNAPNAQRDRDSGLEDNDNKRSVGSVSGDAPRDAHARPADSPEPLIAEPLAAEPLTTPHRRRGKLAPNIEAAVERLVDVMPPEDNGRRNFFELAYQGATEADFGDALGAIREVDNVHDRARYAHRTITNRLAQRAAAC